MLFSESGCSQEQHLNGEESRPLSNPLAERARQLQQQLQQLQALQALQSQQHAGGPSRSSLDGGAQVQATLARQALLQQQLQAQACHSWASQHPKLLQDLQGDAMSRWTG